MGLKSIQKLWITIRSSLWFIPSVMASLSAVLAVIFIELDSGIETDLASKWPRLFGAGAEGARGILESIAGSMITVTGVVFSVVIVALSLASNQYTPRILRNFMRDKGTQVVLGVFVSIFVYCLIVMRTIRGGDDQFVPGLSIVTAIVMALIGIGFLIYFIHHIAESIQASSIITTISRETVQAVENTFPEKQAAVVPFDAEREPHCHVINCKRTGYLQTIAPGIKEFAAKHEIVLKFEVPMGGFVVKRTPLLTVYGTRSLSEREENELQDYFVIADYRSIEQDPAYGIRQLVDIALKALSPSLNDNATAATCIDHIGAILNLLVRREDPPLVEVHDRRPVVIRFPLGVTSIIDEALIEIRQSARGNASIVSHLLRNIGVILAVTENEEYRRALLHHLDLLQEVASQSIQSHRDRHELLEAIARFRRSAGRRKSSK